MIDPGEHARAAERRAWGSVLVFAILAVAFMFWVGFARWLGESFDTILYIGIAAIVSAGISGFLAFKASRMNPPPAP